MYKAMSANALPSQHGDDPGQLHERVRLDIDTVLDEAIGNRAGRHPRLAAAMRYAVIGGGKRFRALLVLAVGELLAVPYAQALRAAAAVECVHAQSLVHDDLPCMDNDDMRRGRPTLHRAFDEATAVLAGDALLALAFEILGDTATQPDAQIRVELVLTLARALGQDGLAGGQMMDLFPADAADEEAMFACEMRKTGSLIRYCVEAGAILGRCDPERRPQLIRFAETLGLMFQVRDDILDVSGDTALVGKALHKDSEQGRQSATVLLGMDHARRYAAALETACYEALCSFGSEAAPLRDLARFAINRAH